jgi:predicted DNA binding CopG/RHH family protein
MRPLQRFTDEYLEQCRKFSPEEIVEFLENFRVVASAGSSKSKLISLKIPEALLEAFRARAEAEGVPYQTQIKRLMKQWLMGSRKP